MKRTDGHLRIVARAASVHPLRDEQLIESCVSVAWDATKGDSDDIDTAIDLMCGASCKTIRAFKPSAPMPDVLQTCIQKLKAKQTVSKTVHVLQKLLKRQPKVLRTMLIKRLIEEEQLMDAHLDAVRWLNEPAEEVLSPVHRRPRESQTEHSDDSEYAKKMQQMMEFVVYLARQRSTALRAELMDEYRCEFVECSKSEYVRQLGAAAMQKIRDADIH